MSNVIARNPFQITTAIAAAATTVHVSENNQEGSSNEFESVKNLENSTSQQSPAKVCL